MPSFEPFFSVNGRLDDKVAPGDRGFAYGDGLFETLLLRAGRLPFLHHHWDRLANGLEVLNLTLNWQRLDSDLNNLLAAAADKAITEGVIKLIVTRGASGRGYRPRRDGHATLVLGIFPLPDTPPAYASDGVDVFVCNHRLPDNARLAGCKHLNKLDYVLAAQEWSGDRYQEALLLDNRGQVVEGNSRNIFVKIKNKLYTPPLNLSGVKGVMRRLVMEQYAPSLAIPVVEQILPLDDVIEAEEVFLCNSITGIWPVKSIDDKTVTMGTTTTALQICAQEDLQRRVEHVD